MAQQTINLGTSPNAGDGDPLRDALDKVNDNFTELYGALVGLLDFKGNTDCSANPNYPAAEKGDAYIVSVAGKIGGASGASVDIGDLYVAKADNAGGTQAAVGTSWFILEHNTAGVLLAANNLSDLANAGTARTNLGLAIGLNVQAYSAALALYAAISPSANVQSMLGAANYAAIRALLGVPNAIAKSGVAASITGTLTETTLGTFSIPAGALGPNGHIEIISLWSSTSNANNKTFKVNFGASIAWTATVTTTSAEQAYTRVANRNAANSQVTWINAGGYGAGTNASVVTFAVDTTSAVTVNLTGTLANTGDTITLESWIARVTYGA